MNNPIDADGSFLIPVHPDSYLGKHSRGRCGGWLDSGCVFCSPLPEDAKFRDMLKKLTRPPVKNNGAPPESFGQ